MRQDGPGSCGEVVDISQKCRMLRCLQVSSDLKRAVRNLEQGAGGSYGAWLGHGFCVVGTLICQEMWVSNSAWLLGRNGA